MPHVSTYDYMWFNKSEWLHQTPKARGNLDGSSALSICVEVDALHHLQNTKVVSILKRQGKIRNKTPNSSHMRLMC